MGDSDRFVGAVATVRSIDTIASSDTVEASTGTRRSRPWRSQEPVRPDHTELPTIDPDHYVFATEIARGGMGRIAIARDLRLGRDVAVKEIIADSDDLARRFEREVRITARLQHPSIVSVHEAGRWPTGEPFYAMKLVSGRSLQDVIASAPTLAQRLASIPNVLAVADAMAYVHRERVIHRDLKPHNVIVGEFGETVVIDWGLAKQLDSPDMTVSGPHAPTATETSAGAVLGTLAYMPPEQAAGDAVDERADVYAIGAILYHVLTGRPPFTAPSFAELLAQVHDETPPPIASIEPDAPADLIAIAERAMTRDRHARYPTAQELADDLRRFQTGQLVGAHRYSLRELLRRWIRRHRAALAAVAVALVVIVAGGVVAVQRVMAEQGRVIEQSEIAKRNQGDALQLMQFMLYELRGRLTELGRLELLESAVRRATAYYEAHHGAGTDDDVMNEAMARSAIAEVQLTKGSRTEVVEQLAKAKELAQTVLSHNPTDARAGVVLVDVPLILGRSQLATGDSTGALASFEEAVAAATRSLQLHPTDRVAVLETAKAKSERAGVLETRGNRERALADERDALALVSQIHRPDDPDVDRVALTAHAHLGRLLLAIHDLDGALAEYRAGLVLGDKQAKRNPTSLVWAWHASNSHDEIGKTLRTKGDLAGALVEFRAAIAIDERLNTIEPANMRWKSSLSAAHESIADTLIASHDLTGAMVDLRAALAIDDDLAARDPANLSWRRDLSVLHNKIGDLQALNKDVAGAIKSYRDGVVVREELVKTDPANTGWQRDLFYSHYRLATLLEGNHDTRQAIVELRLARDLAIPAATRAPDEHTPQVDLANTEAALGSLLADQHDVAGAKPELEAALAIAKRMAVQHPDPSWTARVTTIEKVLADCCANRGGASPHRPPRKP